MNRRPFGRTGMSVSCIGFGAGHIGASDLSDEASGRLLNTALDAGVNLIDTARGYGLSEERIGRHLSHRRGEFLLSTKIGYGVEGHADWSPEIIPAGVTEALRRLRTDYLDIVHLHSCPAQVLRDDRLLAALQAEKQAGRIRAIAYSGENEDLAFALGTGIFDSIQLSVNVADQQSITRFLPVAAKAGLGVIAKRPLANMAWTYLDRPAGTYAEVYWERLQAMALDPGALGFHELALRFVLTVPGVHSCIIGTGRAEHLLANIERAGRGPLDADTYQFIRATFEQRGRDWPGQV